MMEQLCLRRGSDSVENLLAVAVSADQTGGLQTAQVVGDGGRAHADRCRNIENTLLAVAEQPENLKPCAVAELLEGSGHIVADVLGRHRVQYLIEIAVIMRHMNFIGH